MKTTHSKADAFIADPSPEQIIAMDGDDLDALCQEVTKLTARLRIWESVSEMGPAWVSASLSAMAQERQAQDRYRAALEMIRSGLADDRAYRSVAREALK